MIPSSEVPEIPKLLLESSARLISFIDKHGLQVSQVTEEIEGKTIEEWNQENWDSSKPIELSINVHLLKDANVKQTPEIAKGSLVQSTLVEDEDSKAKGAFFNDGSFRVIENLDSAPLQSALYGDLVDQMVMTRVNTLLEDLRKNADPEEQKKIAELSKSLMKELSGPQARSMIRSQIDAAMKDPIGAAKSRLEANLKASAIQNLDMSQILGAYIANHRSTIIGELKHDFFFQLGKSSLPAQNETTEVGVEAEELIQKTLDNIAASSVPSASTIEFNPYTEILLNDYIRTHFNSALKTIHQSTVYEIQKSCVGQGFGGAYYENMLKSKIQDFLAHGDQSQFLRK